MKYLKFIPGLYLVLLVWLFTSMDQRIFHHYSRTDPEFKDYSEEWYFMGKIKDLDLKNNVRIGFTDIKDRNVAGYCNYGLFFNEIDIDRVYWKQSNAWEKMNVIFHELNHCACGRDHGYVVNGQKGEYLDTQKHLGSPGFFNDLCPKSLMFPQILDSTCTQKHFEWYIDEMFEQCKPN